MITACLITACLITAGSSEPWRHETLFLHDRENPRHPPQWFARSEQFAALCPAPFFSEELPFEAGATLDFRYADGAGDSARGSELADHGRQALAATAPTFA